MYGAAVLFDGCKVAELASELLPGAHVVLFGGVDASIEARRAGLHFRDSILVLSPGPKAEQVLLFRRPIEGAVVEQVLSTGTGPINIDVCRIGSGKSIPGSVAKDTSGLGGFGARPGRAGKSAADSGHNPNVGRWPSNLVLIHAPSCTPGLARVNGHKGYPNGPGGSSSQFSQKGQRTTRTSAWQGHSDADGKETIPAWVCAATCPVGLLDAQSGTLVSGTGAVKRSTARGYQGAAYGAESRLEGTTMVEYGDSGGASRFYPQFGSMAEFLVWLEALILPPGTLLYQ